jgi:GntR family transcriptional regulator
MKIERTIDRESKLKLYVQIYTIIKEKIASGEWPEGTQIPTEDELCRTYDVSKVTVREAIQELVREGHLKRQQGKGTFVLYSVPHPGLAMRTRFTDVIDGEGVTVRKEIIEKATKEPSEDIKSILQTPDRVYYVLCKLYVNGELSGLEEIFSPLVTFPAVEDEDILYKSFLAVIEEKGVKKISRIVATAEPSALRGDEALRLGSKEGSCGLTVGNIAATCCGRNRRQDSIRARALFDGYFYCFDSHWSWRRSDHRMHRRGRRFYHHTGVDGCRREGNHGGRHGHFPHIRKGDNGYDRP